jgi:acyl dehydratase
MAPLDLRIGQAATPSNTITREHVDRYDAMTGDRNPLHFDEACAARTPFGRLAVHGGLTRASSARSSPRTCRARARSAA